MTFKKINKLGISVMAISLFLFSCKDGVKTPKGLNEANVKGGELYVIASEKLIKSPIKEMIDTILGAPQIYIPQGEPTFKTFELGPQNLKGYTKLSGNLLILVTNDTRKEFEGLFPDDADSSLQALFPVGGIKVFRKKDVFAYPQNIVFIVATDTKEIIEFFKENADDFRQQMLKFEREVLVKKSEFGVDDSLKMKLASVFGIDLNVPKTYRLAKLVNENAYSFAWLRKEAAEWEQALMIYTHDYNDTSDFSAEHLIAVRDSVTKLHIPATMPNSYMSSEKEFIFPYQRISLNGEYSAELRGFWTTINDYMGGPFYSVTFYHPGMAKLITVEGFLYSPKLDKTYFLRQLESIVNTAKIKK